MYRNPQYPSRCFFTVFEQYCKLFKIDLERDKASFLIRSLSSIKYGVGSDTISNVTKEVLVDAGVPDDYKAHSFRMAVASHLVDCGILIEIVMKIGGCGEVQGSFHKFLFKNQKSSTGCGCSEFCQGACLL